MFDSSIMIYGIYYRFLMVPLMYLLSGELNLTIHGVAPVRKLLVGDTFYLPNGQEHDELYGPEGGTYLVARTN